MTPYKFRLGSDPLENLTHQDVLSRVRKLSTDYANRVADGVDLHPAKVRVWTVALDKEGKCQFAPAKLLGYASTVNEYLTHSREHKPMTGIDAVTALRKRGFLTCSPVDFPEVVQQLEAWIKAMKGTSRSSYRFMIHPLHIERLRKPLTTAYAAYRKLDPLEKQAMSWMIEAKSI